MEFALSDEQKQLRSEIRRFAEAEIRPVAAEYDEAEEYPWEVVETAAEMGLLAPQVPLEYGGSGYDTLDMALIIEELFAADAGIGGSVVSTAYGSEAIARFGTDEQKETYLPDLASGDSICGIAISEPHAGSDVAAISTRAEKSEARSASNRSGATAEEDGDEWTINGTKMWISNGTVGDFFIVLCETDPDAEGRYNGFSQILVESDREGFTAEKITGKMGVRAGDTAELILDDVRVPEENLVGTRGMGFLQQMQFFDELRVGGAAQGLGIAKGAADRALAYAEEREQFDRPISEFQAIQHKLAEMYTQIEAARSLTHKAGWAVDTGRDDDTKLVSMAKEFASRVAVDVTQEAVQILGGAGYVDDFDVERFYRDAKVTQIYEGTTEIQKNIVARELLDKGF
jgi:acyl-CoA dehydrogenase